MNRTILSYTGTLGVLSYDGKELYLWYKKVKKSKSKVSKGIPVPKYYWKVVYDEHERKGVGFLGLNDPYAEDLKETDYRCNNVCDKIHWFGNALKKNKDLEEKGHITCCTIQELAAVVSNINNFKTDSGKYINDDITSLLT